jgi:hypothetical protein
MGRGGRYTMGRGVDIPWVGCQNTMGREVDIPWVGVDIPWVRGS